MVNRKGIRCGAQGCRCFSGHWHVKKNLASGYWQRRRSGKSGVPSLFICPVVGSAPGGHRVIYTWVAGAGSPNSPNLMNCKLGSVPVIALCCLAMIACSRLAAQERNDVERPAKRKNLSWNPPDVDAPLHALAALPPCDLPKVLKETGARAVELTTNLENFTAQEQIEYKRLDRIGFPEESDASLFDYVFAFEQRDGRHVSREYRTPAKGGHAFPTSGQDTGQVALALIFLPTLQTDYATTCEGL